MKIKGYISRMQNMLITVAAVFFSCTPLCLFGQEGGTPAGGQQGARPPGSMIGDMLIPMAIIFFFMYLILIRPQRKRETEHKKMLEAVSKNDEVVTTGGFYGKVTSVKGDDIIIRIDDKKEVHVRVMKSSILKILNKKEANTQEDNNKSKK